MTVEWVWQSGLPVLVALITGCLFGLPGGDSWRTRAASSAVSGLLTLGGYAGIVWLLPDARLWVLLTVLLLVALGNLLRVLLAIALEVAAMEER